MLKKELFGQNPDPIGDKRTFTDAFTDAFAGYPTTKSARMMAAKSSKPVYEYRYLYPSSFTLGDIVNGGMVKLFARVRLRRDL